MRRIWLSVLVWCFGGSPVWAQVTVFYCNDATKTVYGYAINPQSPVVEQKNIEASEGFKASCLSGMVTTTMTEAQWKLFQKGQVVSITATGTVSLSENPIAVKADQDLAEAKTNLMAGKPLTQAQVDVLVKH